MPKRIEPKPGQESVWDYPRPPRIEPSSKRIKIELAGQVLAETSRAQRVLETSHPPVYYVPLEDVKAEYIVKTTRTSFCEFKGRASYIDLIVGDRRVRDAGWFYPNPTATFAAIRDYVAFYPSRMDACFVDDEQVEAQDGDFYGGWITNDIVGPFKGAAGTMGW